MFITVSLAIIYMAILLFCCKLFSKREGYFSTISVFGISALIYYIGIPVEVNLWNSNWVISDYINVTLTACQLDQIIIMGTLALISFTWGYAITGFNPFKQSVNFQRKSADYHVDPSLPILLIIILVIIMIFFREEIISSSTYFGAYTTMYEHPVFAFLDKEVVIIMAVLAAAMFAKKNIRRLLIGFGILSLVIIWGVYTSDKGSLLIGTLSLGALIYSGRLNKSIVSLLLLGTFAVLGIYLFSLVNVYRGAGVFDTSLIRFSLTNFDPAGPFASIAYVLNNPDDLSWGSTYLGTLYNWIPRFIWLDRPLDLSEQFARELLPNWQPGQGLGYSLLAEAYQNFSWMGIIIQYSLIGLIWGYFWKFLRKTFFIHYSNRLWKSLYITFGYYLIIIMHRGPITALTKSMIIYIVPLAISAIIFDFCISNNKKDKIESKRLLPEKSFIA